MITTKFTVAVPGSNKEYSVGPIISRDRAIEIIKSGKFVQVVWKKNSGELASRNVRFGVQKTLNGGTTVKDHSEYLPVTDMGKYNGGNRSRSWINIKLSTIIGVVIDGQMHLVK